MGDAEAARARGGGPQRAGGRALLQEADDLTGGLAPPVVAGRFLRSTRAALSSQLWRVGMTFLAELLLRRLVEPEDWGIYEWTLTVFLVAGAVRDLGLVYHVARLRPRPLGNLLASELVWGGALVLFTFVGAPLLARGFSQPHPELVQVIRAFSVFLFLEGLASVPKVFFESDLEIGRMVLPEIVRNLVFVGGSLALAVAGLGIWSLVLAQLAASAVQAGHLWWRAWGRMELHYARGRTGSLILASLPLAGVWLLMILIENVDPLILGTRFDGEIVGNYKFAYKYAFITKIVFMPAIGRALYPALIALAGRRDELFRAFRLATLAILTCEAPVAYLLFFNPQIVLRLVGGDRWIQAPGFLLILAFAPLADPLSRFGGEVLKALRLDRWWLISSTLTLLAFVVGGIYLSGVLGPRGMAWANYLPLGGLVMAWVLYRVAPKAFTTLLGDLVVVYLAPLPFFAAAAMLAGPRPVLRLVLSVAALAPVLLVYLRRFGPAFRRFLATASSAAALPDPR